MSKKTYGTLSFSNGKWIMEAEPHVILRAKHLFKKTNKGEHYGIIKISNTPDVCKDIEWFCQRYPMKNTRPELLQEGISSYDQKAEKMESILSPDYQPEKMDMALPLRHYQAQAVSMVHANGSLLICDDAGLGKTPTGVGVFSRMENRPALVVCQTSLVHQWANEQIPKFLPNAKVHIIKKRTPYDLPAADVYVCSYGKLSGWADVFVSGTLGLKTVVYDEVQELRRSESEKWKAASAISKKIPYKCALSATPVFNYGEEFFPVISVISPGSLGTYEEFKREWCVNRGTHWLIQSPRVFGSFLRENYLMIARTRKEVGRELPPLTKIIHTVDYNEDVMKVVETDAKALAWKILNSPDHLERGRSAREFDMQLRQATGVAKALQAAEFIRMLAVNNSVLVVGWHRQVYSILLNNLTDLNPVMWTGEESAVQKQASKEKFMSGESKVMIMSQGSAAGVDGLQDVCQIIVFVELAWNDGVHQQCIWRLLRDRADGIENNVTAFFLVADGGSDPVISQLIGLKASQLDGIVGTSVTEDLSPEEQLSRIKQLAQTYLNQTSAPEPKNKDDN